MKTEIMFVMLPADLGIPGMSRPELLRWLGTVADQLPVVMIAGDALVSNGAPDVTARSIDLIELRAGELRVGLQPEMERASKTTLSGTDADEVAMRFARLTPRQRQIMDMVLAGQPSKNIAADLGVSQRTVENHRAAIMKRTKAKSLPELVRLSLAAN